jgi:hypothetical protein
MSHQDADTENAPNLKDRNSTNIFIFKQATLLLLNNIRTAGAPLVQIELGGREFPAVINVNFKTNAAYRHATVKGDAVSIKWRSAFEDEQNYTYR